MLADILICLRFFSRIPVPTTRREIRLGAGGLAAAAAMAPVAGLAIGLVPAGILLCATILGVPPGVAGALAVAASLAVSGALHEDGLADCADGFGGGSTRERKLAIMRDSRVGAYGVCAIGVSLLARTEALAALAARDPVAAAAALLATASLSRTLGLLPSVLLPPARADGNGAMIRPSPTRVAAAVAIALVLAFVPVFSGIGPARIVGAITSAAAAALGMMALARRMIGGQTGDVAGATQQVAEIAMLVVFSAAP